MLTTVEKGRLQYWSLALLPCSCPPPPPDMKVISYTCEEYMNVCECEKTRIVEMLTIHMTRTDLNELTERRTFYSANWAGRKSHHVSELVVIKQLCNLAKLKQICINFTDGNFYC